MSIISIAAGSNTPGLGEAESGGRDAWRAPSTRTMPARTGEAGPHRSRAATCSRWSAGSGAHADGRYRWHLCRAIPLRDPDGRVTKWFGTCTDIDDQKRSGEAMREAQKLESIGLLAGGVAHDFNNLLTGILGNTSLVLDELPASSRLRPMLENVMLASERAADLTRQLLAYSGKGRFFVQSSDISVLVREISSLIQSSIPKKVQLRLELAPDLPLVEIDTAQIQQLIMNLVINGAEAIGEDRSGHGASSARCCARWTERSSSTTISRWTRCRPDVTSRSRFGTTAAAWTESVRAAHLRPVLHYQVHGARAGAGGGAGHRARAQGEHPDRDGTRAEGRCSRCCCRRARRASKEPKAAGTAQRELRGSGSVLVVDDEEVVRKRREGDAEHYGYTVLEARERARRSAAVPPARGRNLGGAARHDDAGDGRRGGAGGDPRRSVPACR